MQCCEKIDLSVPNIAFLGERGEVKFLGGVMGINCSCHMLTHGRLGDHPSDFCDQLAATVSERIAMSERSGMASGKAAGIGGGAACGIDFVRILILASGKAAGMGGGAACGFEFVRILTLVNTACTVRRPNPIKTLNLNGDALDLILPPRRPPYDLL